MSISQNFPNTRPSLNLNFARSKTLDPRITFSRTSAGTYVDDNGLVVTAAADEPRFDHDPETGECLGLLVEEQRKNFATYSEDFTQWTNTNTTDAIDTSITAPDGTNTATKITDDSTNAAHNVKFVFTTDSSDTFTLSCFVKKGDFSYFVMVLRMAANSENVYATFDFDNPSNNTTYGNGTNRSQTVTEYPNEWYRISLTSTFGAAVTDVTPHIHLTDSSGTISYSGSGNYNYIWGAQLESGSFSTSYIPTSGSTFTRNPDNVSMTGDNFSDWYNQSEGSFYMNIRNIQQQPTGGAYTRLIDLRGTPTGDNYYLLAVVPNSRAIYNEMKSNGSSQFNYSATYPVPNSPTGMVKITVGLQQNNVIAYNFASQFLSDTTVTLPILNSLYIGRDAGGGSQPNGHISQLTYYPVRLPNSTLQTLTK